VAGVDAQPPPPPSLSLAGVHDLTLAARWCDRVVLLAAGRVIGDGKPDVILTPPRLAIAYSIRLEVLRGGTGLVIAPS